MPSPVFRAMEGGKIVRFEEVTRCPAEVQDALITILSEKVLTVPELGIHIHARRGFSLIGTANTRDRGVNDMSAALKRRSAAAPSSLLRAVRRRRRGPLRSEPLAARGSSEP